MLLLESIFHFNHPIMNYFKFIPLTFLYIVCFGCNKTSFLEGKPDQALVIPETIEEIQAILDNINVMNGTGQGVVPVIGEIGSDNYYAFKFPTSSVGPVIRRLYVWGH